MRRLPSAASVHDAARNVLAAWERVKATDDVSHLTQLDDAMEHLRTVIEAPPSRQMSNAGVTGTSAQMPPVGPRSPRTEEARR